MVALFWGTMPAKKTKTIRALSVTRLAVDLAKELDPIRLELDNEGPEALTFFLRYRKGKAGYELQHCEVAGKRRPPTAAKLRKKAEALEKQADTWDGNCQPEKIAALRAEAESCRAKAAEIERM